MWVGTGFWDKPDWLVLLSWNSFGEVRAEGGDFGLQ